MCRGSVTLSCSESVTDPRHIDLASLQLDHVVVVVLRPDVGQPVVDFATRANLEKRYLVVDELNVAVIRRVIRIGEANQPTRLDDEEVVVAVDVLRERLARRELE